MNKIKLYSRQKVFMAILLGMGIHLSGCGGGGGSTAIPGGTSGNAATSGFSIDNYDDVAMLTYELGTLMASQVDVVNSGPGMTISATSTPLRVASLGRARVAATQTRTETCDTGSGISTDTVAVENMLSVGDVFLSDYNECWQQLAPGYRVYNDGQSQMTILAAEGNPQLIGGLGIYEVETLYEQMTFGFRSDPDPVELIHMDGDITSRYERTSTHFSQTLHSTSLSQAFSTGSGAEDRFSFSEMNFFHSEQFADNRYTNTFRYGVDVSIPDFFAGSLSVNADIPFTGVMNLPPVSGAMTVMSEEGDVIRLLVLNDQQVEVSLDQNGDGSVEQQMIISWSELEW